MVSSSMDEVKEDTKEPLTDRAPSSLWELTRLYYTPPDTETRSMFTVGARELGRLLNDFLPRYHTVILNGLWHDMENKRTVLNKVQSEWEAAASRPAPSASMAPH